MSSISATPITTEGFKKAPQTELFKQEVPAYKVKPLLFSCLKSFKSIIQILEPRQTWRVYESFHSKYVNSKEWGFILYEINT